MLLSFIGFFNKYLYSQPSIFNRTNMGIVSLSIPEDLLEEVDSHFEKKGFSNRSEIIRQALRLFLSENRKIDQIHGKITASITIIYRRTAKTGQIAEIQHNFSNIVLTFLHTHVEEGFCIEIIVVKGESQQVKSLITALRSNKQISEVKVTIL